MPAIFFYKRGVSPLIATILLIFFAIVLGATVINWAPKMPSDDTESPFTAIPSDLCEGVQLTVEESSDDVKICYFTDVDTRLQFVLKNDGVVKIHGLKLYILGQHDEPFSKVIKDSSIEPGDGLKKEVLIPPDLGAPQKVEIIPIIKSDVLNRLLVCTPKKWEEPLIEPC
ncbi:hypothetical protein HYW21_05070 [Candidatus Woesearchaeota archaeon]|nr:hypothetical protein [Candidatus Woesearchaeota archaeon]